MYGSGRAMSYQPPVPPPPVAYSADGRYWWDGRQWLPTQPQPLPAYPVVPGYAPYPAPGGWALPARSPFAEFWLRFVAYLIDAVVLSIVAIPINLALFGNSGAVCGATPYTITTPNGYSTGTNYGCNATGGGTLIYLGLGLLYFALMWSRGATLGQRALSLRVVDSTTGGLLSIARCVIRYVGFCLSVIPLCLGLIWAGFDPRKQGWHDKMARSVVVRGGTPAPGR